MTATKIETVTATQKTASFGLVPAMLMLVAPLVLSGCEHFKPYRIEVPQGVPLTSEKVSWIALGQPAEYVLARLGTPPVAHTLPNNVQVWEYPFFYSLGTYAKREDITTPNSQYFVVTLKKGIVTKLSGVEGVPEQPQKYPIQSAQD